MGEREGEKKEIETVIEIDTVVVIEHSILYIHNFVHNSPVQSLQKHFMLMSYLLCSEC